MRRATQTGLVRGIKRWDMVALTINMIIGAGIFGLPSKIYSLTGIWSVLAYLICAVLVTLIILCFAEVGSRFAETGGPYLYARLAFGSGLGFVVGWLLWLARITAFAALCNLLLGYLSFFLPSTDSGWTRSLVITIVVIVLTIVNVIGVRESVILNNLFTVLKLAPLLLFVVAGFFFLNPQPFTIPTAPHFGDFARAVLLLIFAFSGFEMVVIPAGETHDPQRHIAFALLMAMGVVVLLYLLIQVVCIGTLPELANSERPLVDASRQFFGAAGASLISVGALLSVTGTLNSSMLAGPRILFAMAEQQQMPQFLAATHQRFRTPHIAILISAVVVLVLTLQGTFMSALTISTVIRLLAYIATCIALPILRFRTDVPMPRFSAPAGVAIAVAATLLSIWLLSFSPLKDLYVAGLAAWLGLPLFFLRTKSGKSNSYCPISQNTMDT